MQGNKVAITGVGETAFLRKGTNTLMHMMAEACLAAIADAGLTPADIDGYIGNRMVPGSDDMGFAIGMKDRAFSAVTDVAGGTAPAGQALTLAPLAIEPGFCRPVFVPSGIQSTK